MIPVRRGEVWWVELTPEPRGSEPGFRRPVVVVQDDHFNRSTIETILVVAVTRNMGLSVMPGNVVLARRETGLRHDSVANVTALITVDRVYFGQPGRPLGKLSKRTMDALGEGLSLVLSL